MTILHKTRVRGMRWLWQRAIRELRLPETKLGEMIKPISKKVHPFFPSISTVLNLNTLYLFYDLEVSPITFDLCWVLCNAEVERKKLGLRYIQLIVVPGPHNGLREETSDYEVIIDKNARDWRKFNLLLPLAHLLPSCLGVSLCASRQEAAVILKKASSHIYPKNYSTAFPIAHAFMLGAQNPNIMALKANSHALQRVQEWLQRHAKDKKTVVITLRQYAYMPKRNSNIEAWAHFAKQLDPKQFFVVIVPDTEMVMQGPNPELAPFAHFTEACWNIELRAALYESAYINLGINNGPSALCWLNENCRYILFKLITEEVPQTSEAALRKFGFTPGETPIFAKEYQKWVWESDTADTIKREFDEMCKLLFAKPNSSY